MMPLQSRQTYTIYNVQLSQKLGRIRVLRVFTLRPTIMALIRSKKRLGRAPAPTFWMGIYSVQVPLGIPQHMKTPP